MPRLGPVAFAVVVPDCVSWGSPIRDRLSGVGNVPNSFDRVVRADRPLTKTLALIGVGSGSR